MRNRLINPPTFTSTTPHSITNPRPIDPQKQDAAPATATTGGAVVVGPGGSGSEQVEAAAATGLDMQIPGQGASQLLIDRIQGNQLTPVHVCVLHYTTIPLINDRSINRAMVITPSQQQHHQQPRPSALTSAPPRSSKKRSSGAWTPR
jgi:hypothetical protein